MMQTVPTGNSYNFTVLNFVYMATGFKTYSLGGFIGEWGEDRAPPVVGAATAVKHLLAQVASLLVQYSTYLFLSYR
jgi:hypothetical protein